MAKGVNTVLGIMATMDHDIVSQHSRCQEMAGCGPHNPDCWSPGGGGLSDCGV